MNTRSPLVTARAVSKLASIHSLVRASCLSLAYFVMASVEVSAISFSIVEDSPKRLAFDLVWGPNVAAPASFRYLGGPIDQYISRHIGGRDSESFLAFQATYSPIHDLFPDAVQVLDFSQGLYSDRRFELLDVVQPAAVVQVLPLDPASDDSLYGARFVYGAPYPSSPPIGAPDGGSSAVLMALGFVGISIARLAVLRG